MTVPPPCSPLLRLAILFLGISTALPEDGPETSDDSAVSFEEEIALHREKIRTNLLEHEYSPIRSEEAVARIHYFDPDPSFRILCRFETVPPEKARHMTTTHGGSAPFVRFGHLSFERDGRAHRLTVFQRDYDGPDYWFIPFRDLTSGKSTYGGGRYLDFKAEWVTDGEVLIDFNRSYNPWCHYDEKLACPVPPPENALEIEVEAGEKKYPAPK